jgi:ligand-binding SRPBCC domain-containing protein
VFAERKEYLLKRSVWVRRPIEEVFPFFAAAENLGRITPPELGFRIDSPTPVAMHRGATIDYTIRLYRMPMKWRTGITKWDPPHYFEDTQLAGPYAKWVHTHRFTEYNGGTTIDDRVEYVLPFGTLGHIAWPLVRRQLDRIFDYRTEVMLERFR